MGFVEILAIAVAMAMDAFAVSLGIGTTGQARGPRPLFRLSFHFGLFQALMPVLGWFAASRVVGIVTGVGAWIAVALLAFVGVRMVIASLNPQVDAFKDDPSRGATLMMLCVATSLDALAVGASLGVLGVSIVYPSIVIGVVTAGLSLGGLLGGCCLGRTCGRWAELLGGLLLNGIGLRILLGSL